MREKALLAESANYEGWKVKESDEEEEENVTIVE